MASPRGTVGVNGFKLSELIEATSNELRALRAKKVKDPVMRFAGFELELSVTAKAEGGGGLRFWVVDASTKIAGESVSKIKLVFHPVSENEVFAR